MKKLLIFTSILISLIYLSSAIDIVLNSGQKLESGSWNNLSGVLNKVDVFGDNLSINGKLVVNGKICTDSGCLGECNAGYYWDTSTSSCKKNDLLTSTDCTNAGWIWVDSSNDIYIGSSQGNGFCISPRIGDFGDTDGKGLSWNGWGNYNDFNYNGWNSSVLLNGKTVDDTGNQYPEYGQTKNLTHVNDIPILYRCSVLGELNSGNGNIGGDTIVGRMKWLVNNKANISNMHNIPWVEDLSLNNSHAIPSIYIADCIDGVKDLGKDMVYKHTDDSGDLITYEEYNTDVTINTENIVLTNVTYRNRQRYLTAWTQKSGSHLPSAFSYIIGGTSGGCPGVICNNLTGNGRGEYQVACEANLLTDSNDDTDNERIRLSALGHVDGAGWGRTARTMGADNCSFQSSTNIGPSDGSMSARFVIRP